METASREANPAVPQVVDTLIVGAGFGGLCMGIALDKADRGDWLILEKGQEVGGTWRDNQYPGAACDVQSHLYSYSFAPKADWSRRYAGWDEIQRYILDVTARYGLRSRIRFGREVVAATWDEAAARWTLQTADGARYVCRQWVLASGPLHVPAMPDIPGLARFAGPVWHSARWRHDVDLAGKRVASIGSGGSAIQYVPEIAPRAGHVTVFQRTPAWVIPRDMRRYPRWRQRLFAAVPWLRALHRARLYWSNESRVWPLFHPALARLIQPLVAWSMRRQVRDPALAARLVPDYTIGCKRILISNEWLKAFNRDNVDLVTARIAEITPTGVVTADGREHPADVLILGTGFVVDPRLYMKDFTLSGRAGHRIGTDWAQTPTAYLGISMAGYPNMFQLVGPHTALGHNSIIFMIEAQVQFIVAALRERERRHADSIDVRPEAQADFLAGVRRGLAGTVWESGCKSWYQAADGTNFTLWPGATWRYWLACRNPEWAHFSFAGRDA